MLRESFAKPASRRGKRTVPYNQKEGEVKHGIAFDVKKDKASDVIIKESEIINKEGETFFWKIVFG